MHAADDSTHIVLGQVPLRPLVQSLEQLLGYYEQTRDARVERARLWAVSFCRSMAKERAHELTPGRGPPACLPLWICTLFRRPCIWPPCASGVWYVDGPGVLYTGVGYEMLGRDMLSEGWRGCAPRLVCRSDLIRANKNLATPSLVVEMRGRE